MKAILIVFDMPESVLQIRPLTWKPPGAMENPPGPPAEEMIRKKCNCVRNGSIQKAKKLLKHLRGAMKMPKKDITLFRTSKFKSSGDAVRKLRRFFRRNQNEDVVLFFSGHGSRFEWYLGGEGPKEKVIRYSDLESALNYFKGRLVVLSECCHALALNQYLSALGGRYMLIGASRAENLGDAFLTVLNEACWLWKARKIADIKIGFIHTIMDHVTGKISKVDIVSGESLISGNLENCACADPVIETEKIPEGEQQSLRRGSYLDFLLYPPE